MHSKTVESVSFNSITNKPTSIAGYGITNAVTTTGNQTIAGNKTFTGTISADSLSLTNKTSKWVIHGLNLKPLYASSGNNITVYPYSESHSRVEASSIGTFWASIPITT